MKTYRSKTTGSFVGRQADQVDGEEYEIVEVPTDKDGLLGFINKLHAEQVIPSPVSDVPAPPVAPRPQPTKEEEAILNFRAAIAEGRVEIDEWLLRAPLDMCLRLAGLIHERIRDHFVKEQKNAS